MTPLGHIWVSSMHFALKPSPVIWLPWIVLSEVIHLKTVSTRTVSLVLLGRRGDLLKIGTPASIGGVKAGIRPR